MKRILLLPWRCRCWLAAHMLLKFLALPVPGLPFRNADLCERGSLRRRGGGALGGSLDQLGHVPIVVIANDMTAS